MLIATCWNTITDTFKTLKCKHCKYETMSAFKMWYHHTFHHKHKFTKRDYKFLAIYNLATRLVLTILCSIGLLILIPLKIITLPLYYLHEIL